MKYHEILGLLKEGKIEDINKKIIGGKKNDYLAVLRDYYNGVQWFSNQTFTDTTRSGRKVWKINSPDPRDLGVSQGDLAIFNVCSPTVDVYSSYGRGSINDQNSISIENDQELAKEINKKINLDVLIQRSITRMSVDSVVCYKFMADKSLEMVDVTQTTPIYLEDKIVGTIRSYEISADDAIIQENEINLGKRAKAIYTEIWIPIDGKMWLYKFINKNNISDAEAPYAFNPFIFIANKNSEFTNFDENNLEISDIEKIIPIQDSINKTMTELGIIVSKVAFPIIKVIKEVYEKVMEGKLDAGDLEKQLSQLSLVAGKIIAAPIEIQQGAGLPAGISDYTNSLFDQLYRITGVPKSIYVTEGMGNIASDTLSTLMESLKRRIDEKRANIENGIKQYVAMYTMNPDIKDSVSIQWAEMFEMTKKEKAEILIQENNIGMPKSYTVSGFLDLMGDADKYAEVMQLMGEADPELKIQIEREQLSKELREEAQNQLSSEQKKRETIEKELQNTKVENAMLTNELQTINSQL